MTDFDVIHRGMNFAKKSFLAIDVLGADGLARQGVLADADEGLGSVVDVNRLAAVGAGRAGTGRAFGKPRAEHSRHQQHPASGGNLLVLTQDGIRTPVFFVVLAAGFSRFRKKAGFAGIEVAVYVGFDHGANFADLTFLGGGGGAKARALVIPVRLFFRCAIYHAIAIGVLRPALISEPARKSGGAKPYKPEAVGAMLAFFEKISLSAKATAFRKAHTASLFASLARIAGFLADSWKP